MSDHIEFMGAAINGIYNALLNRDLLLTDFSRRDELEHVQDREFYPLSLYVDLCNYLEERLGKYAFLRVGRKMAIAVMDTAFPPNLKTIPEAIAQVNAAHQVFCRPVVGAFDVTHQSPGKIVVQYSAPYNCILQEGLFYEVALRYGAENATVTHTECRRTGATACRFDIKY